MTKRDTLDQSGAESIHYMKTKNFAHMSLWAVILVGIFVLIQYFVMEQYRQIGEAGSIGSFLLMLGGGLAYIAILSALWWFGAANERQPFAGLRNFFEQHSFGCAIAFDILALFGILLLNLFGESGIYGKNKHFYPLHCIFVFPVAFICLMYAVPPVNIQQVVFPGKKPRWLIAGLAAITALVLFTKDFIFI